MFGYRVGFSGTADRTALFSVRTNPRWRRHLRKKFKWPYLRNRSSDPLIGLYMAYFAIAIAQLSCIVIYQNSELAKYIE